MMFHDSLRQMLETAVCYDQLDVGNPATMEFLCRQIQIIEEQLKDKFYAGTGESAIDLHLMSGLSNRAKLCICPSLSTFVASEAAKDTAVMKERRKAREERALLKPKE